VTTDLLSVSFVFYGDNTKYTGDTTLSFRFYNGRWERDSESRVSLSSEVIQQIEPSEADIRNFLNGKTITASGAQQFDVSASSISNLDVRNISYSHNNTQAAVEVMFTSILDNMNVNCNIRVQFEYDGGWNPRDVLATTISSTPTVTIDNDIVLASLEDQLIVLSPDFSIRAKTEFFSAFEIFVNLFSEVSGRTLNMVSANVVYNDGNIVFSGELALMYRFELDWVVENAGMILSSIDLGENFDKDFRGGYVFPTVFQDGAALRYLAVNPGTLTLRFNTIQNDGVFLADLIFDYHTSNQVQEMENRVRVRFNETFTAFILEPVDRDISINYDGRRYSFNFDLEANNTNMAEGVINAVFTLEGQFLEGASADYAESANITLSGVAREDFAIE
jgi:hypothetical protein